MKYFLLLIAFTLSAFKVSGKKENKTPVDYVNPYIGNISHMLVPTYPTVHLPNSLLRVYPERENYTGNRISGLPLVVTSHRGNSAFTLSPYQGSLADISSTIAYSYDNEVIKPYYYSVDLDDYDIHVQFAPSHQSAIYEFDFTHFSSPMFVFKTRKGEIKTNGNSLSGYQELGNNTKVYIYFETNIKPIKVGTHLSNKIDANQSQTQGENAYFILEFPENTKKITARYGISYISEEQAMKNLQREIKDYSLSSLVKKGRQIWNETLSKINVEGDDEEAKVVFYTSLYRTYERMINISEDGRYFSAYDGKVHNDEGRSFYVDDWIWDTYHATHPLRVIIEPEMEGDMIFSFIRMASQMKNKWMPTFPEVNGDSRRMNSNHAVATVIDAYIKGLRTFDLEEAYQYSKAAITEKTLAPWSSKPAGVLDEFYKKHGYFPCLAKDEKETVPEVHSWEKRQPIAVTLGTVYDEWCLGNIAKQLGKEEEATYFLNRSLNYRKVFNPKTKFFHPKDTFGVFMEDLDYRFPPSMGARDAYDENNGYIYRWDVAHNIGDLVQLMGGNEAFINELEHMYNEPLGRSKYDFYASYPDHTGNVGQFSMGNEPSMRIPYLYNYAGQPWRTQKRIRTLLDQWFRDDLMGIPGDEDGGGLTSFVVFSQIGFYPITPGLPMYVIGSPVFKNVTINIGEGKTFIVNCLNYDPEHKYIQSATLNGKPWNKSWFSHDELMQGGVLEFIMGKHPNKQWGTDKTSIPPSFKMNN